MPDRSPARSRYPILGRPPLTHLAVVGAGPAGLSAAIAARAHGIAVTVIDEGPRPGGRLLGQLHPEPGGGWWNGQAIAADLTERARRAGVRIRTGKQVWGVEPDQSVDSAHTAWSIGIDTAEPVHADCVIIATGATETPLPVPGWTVPGVMAIGAAQTLTNFYRVRPGARAAVVGVDPLALTVSREMLQAGVDIVGIFAPQADTFSGVRAVAADNVAALSRLADLAPTRALGAAGRIARNSVIQQIAGRAYPRRGIPVWGTRLHLRRAVTAIAGSDQVEAVHTRRTDRYGRPAGPSRSILVDCVCISGGLAPLFELSHGGDRVQAPELGGEVPLTGPVLQGTEPGMFFAGNVTGIEGATVALAQGHLAGLGAAAWSGVIDQNAAQLRDAQRMVDQARRDAAITFLPYVHTGRARLAAMWRSRCEAAAP